jgi:F-type H+-transporting ATPase subunit epsilon
MADDIPPGKLRCVVVTPEGSVLDEIADFVALPMYDGELGVLHGRAPLVGRLGFGELRIRQGDRLRRYFVDGGFVQVRANVVTVLTDRALRPEQIKVDEANEVLAHSLTLAPTPEDQEQQLQAADRARAQLRVAQYRAATP